MNLFKLHKDLIDHEDQDLIPFLAWDKYRNNPEELKKREKMWARDPQTAYSYAKDVLKGQFELGEKAIAKDALNSYSYATQVLNSRFKLGEKAIAKSAKFSYLYAVDVVHGRFELGEPAIAKEALFQSKYENYVKWRNLL